VNDGTPIVPALRAATRGEAEGWWLVGLLSVTATASYLCRVNLSVVGVFVMREFALTQVQMGPVFSAFLLTYAIAQVPAGALADRFGAPRVLFAAALWWAAATLVQSTAGAGWLWPANIGPLAVLIAGRLILGIGEAPTFTAAAQGISRWMRPESHGRANGFVIAAVGAGSAIAPPLLTWAMLHVGWRGALVVSAVPAIIAAVAWKRVSVPGRSEAPARVEEQGASDAGPAGTRLPFVLLTASYTLQGYVGYIFVFWFYLYLVQERHFDLLRGAFLGSLPWVLTIVSVPLGGFISDVLARRGGSWRIRAVPMTGLIGAGVFIAVGARTENPWVAAFALAGATGLVMCVEGPFWATMTRLSGGRAGRAGGIMNMGCNLGGLVSPALTPWLAARIGWAHALDVAAVLSVAGGLLWLGIARSIDQSGVEA
jgi:MFS transporter, ACS family, glucarate transporter